MTQQLMVTIIHFTPLRLIRERDERPLQWSILSDISRPPPPSHSSSRVFAKTGRADVTPRSRRIHTGTHYLKENAGTRFLSGRK